jgi:hypothetical protein
MYQYFRIYGPPKLTQIGIFGWKINHLATLVPELAKPDLSFVVQLLRYFTYIPR